MEEYDPIDHVNGGTVRVPTNMAIARRNGAIAIGNPGNRLADAFGRVVNVGVRKGAIAFAHPGRRGFAGSVRNAAHTLLGGVIMNMSRKFTGRLSLMKIKCHTRLRNGGLMLGMKCSRPIRFAPRSNVRIRMPSGAGVVIGNCSGTGINTLTTGVHNMHPPRPCGNGKVGCIGRVVHHGRNGANGW